MLLAAGETMAMVSPVEAVPLASAVDFHIDAGGAESNVAGHFVACGGHARWVSRLGDDPLGHRVADQLAARGIDVSQVVFGAEHRTGAYFKDPGNGVFYYRDGSAASHLSIADADAVAFDGVAVLHVSGITAALTGTAPQFLDRLMVRARGAGVTVSFDVNYRAGLWPIEVAAPVLARLAGEADIVFVGQDEADVLWGATTPRAVRDVLGGQQQIVIKDGDIGATLVDGTDAMFVPAHRIDVVEAVGAGDAFAGGYLAAHFAGASPKQCLQAGHDRAALALSTTSDFPDAHTKHEKAPQ